MPPILFAKQVDKLHARAAVARELLTLLRKKTNSFAKQKDRDERQHDDRHECLSAEKGPDRLLTRQAEDAASALVDLKLRRVSRFG